jgi:hypothetical protein
MTVLRCEKIKDLSTAASIDRHNRRLYVVPNADPNRASMNLDILTGLPLQESQPLTGSIKVRLSQIPRQKRGIKTNAVIAQEFILSYSHGGLRDDQIHEWADANLAFFSERFGRANIVQLVLHADEMTPHLHMLIIPVTKDGRLCAKDIFNPKGLRVLQTDYAMAMGPFGLQRGEYRSRAIHTTLADFYKIIGKHEPAITAARAIQKIIEQLEAGVEEREQNIRLMDKKLADCDRKIRAHEEAVASAVAAISQLEEDIRTRQATLDLTDTQVQKRKDELKTLSEKLVHLTVNLKRAR